jgi:hypothetical protein
MEEYWLLPTGISICWRKFGYKSQQITKITAKVEAGFNDGENC